MTAEGESFTMKIVRFQCDQKISYGIFAESTGTITEINSLFDLKPTGKSFDRINVRLLAPVEPRKIVCIGLNYREHAAEFNIPIPKFPVFFFKPTSTIIGPEDSILLPHLSRQVEYEGELGIVIGTKCKNVLKENALEHVLGFTCTNDVTARDIQQEDKTFTKAKCFDTFCPVGPWIETNLDLNDTRITTTLNDQTVQSSSIANMIRPVSLLISYISLFMTLEPGDLILTGSPPGTKPMQHGDKVSVTITGIGTLNNHVIESIG